MGKKEFKVKVARDPNLEKGTAILSADLYFLLQQGRLVFYLKPPPPQEKTKAPSKTRDRKRKEK